jgi:hypothetical protein
MRFYSIIITDAKTGALYTPPGFGNLLGNQSYGSYANGQTLPSAWNVEIDIAIINAATPANFGTVRIWGISLQEISQANNLAGKNIKVFAGMTKGLPLANPAEQGLICQGKIFQAFGNWIGTAMTLDLVVMPGPFATSSNTGGVGTLGKPKNIVLNWKAGTPFGQAIQNALQTAYPGAQITLGNINPNIATPAPGQFGKYPTIEEFGWIVQQLSKNSIDPNGTQGYPGVMIVVTSQGGFLISDNSNPQTGNAKQIAFQDLIGQPTWIEAGMISVKTVMRGDLTVFQQVTLPPYLIQNTQAANSSLVNLKATFQGGFWVHDIHHYGDFRQPSADAWVTVFTLAPNQQVLASNPPL